MEETESTPSVSISVLIVSHNCEPALRRCLTALEQSEQRETFEILTVDCGSIDGCESVDEDFPEVTVRRLPRHFGKTKARNIGIRSARGGFLLLLEPDVEVAPDTVSKLAAALAEAKGVAGVCPLLVDGSGAPVSHGGDLPSPGDLYESWASGSEWAATALPPLGESDEPIPVECPDPGAMMVRTSSVRAMNYLDERYGEFGSDLDYFTQAVRASKPILVLPDIRARCRRGEDYWRPSGEAAQTTLHADFGSGLIAYTAKHYGWTKALQIRLRVWLRALLGFRLGLLGQLLNGQKVDGSQTAF